MVSRSNKDLISYQRFRKLKYFIEQYRNYVLWMYTNKLPLQNTLEFSTSLSVVKWLLDLYRHDIHLKSCVKCSKLKLLCCCKKWWHHLLIFHSSRQSTLSYTIESEYLLLVIHKAELVLFFFTFIRCIQYILLLSSRIIFRVTVIQK